MVALLVPAQTPGVYDPRRCSAPTNDPEQQRARRVWLNVLVRRASSSKNAVPSLGSTRPLKAWRKFHQLSYDGDLRRFRRELRTIAGIIGPPPKFFKPRPGHAADRRIGLFYPLRKDHPTIEIASKPEPEDTQPSPGGVVGVVAENEATAAEYWRDCPNETDRQRAERVCIGCGKPKEIGLVVCWHCFKYREDTQPYKYWQGELAAWVAQLPK